MMAPSEAAAQTAKFQFGLNGLVIKANPSLLGDSQYRSMYNLEVNQEGSIASRTGRKDLGTPAAGIGYCYGIQKIVVTPGESPSTPSTNPRYVGLNAGGGVDLYRTLDYATFTKVASAINSSAGALGKGFRAASYTAGNVGSPWAFIASENLMLKDKGSSPYGTLRRWGILPAFGVATAADSGVAGLLDGGASGSPADSTAYDYRYCGIGSDTNNKGNPSQTMLEDSAIASGVPIAVHLKKVTVTVYGTDDPQISQIAIFRRGGLLFDAWRLVGKVTNPGIGATTTFTDNVSDLDLETAELLETDNDPPVSSTVPTPITGTFSGAVSAGRQTVTLATGGISGATAGTTVHIPYDSPEDVVIEQVVSSTSFIAVFQHAHANGATIEIDTITAQPAAIVVSFQQFLVVGGDPNNPHMLYRSKGDHPEAFSTLPADGSTSSVACGTPSNPMLDATVFRDHIVTLNLYGLFETLLYNGSFLPASQASTRGPVGHRAWCQTETEIWFTAFDGVWSWDGSGVRKRSEAIDQIFHSRVQNGFTPVDFANYASSVVMETRRGEVHINYIDTAGSTRRLICEPGAGDRWKTFQVIAPVITHLYVEPDTQSMIETRGLALDIGFSMADQVVTAGGVNYTSDFYAANPITQGSAIPFEMYLPWFDMGAAAEDKIFEEVLLELDVSGSDSVGGSSLTVEVLVNYSDTPVSTVTVPVNLIGRTLVSMLPGAIGSLPAEGFGKQARAISFRIFGSAYPTRISFYSLIFRWQPTGVLTAGAPSDWITMGTKSDKRLYQMQIEYDSGVDALGIPTTQTVVLDTLTGRDGRTYTEAAQTFTFKSAVTKGSNRGVKTMPVNDATIVKAARVRPLSTLIDATHSTAQLFKILSVEFVKEDYPADIVEFTNWSNDGYEYLKYAQQVVLEVNTNDVEVEVELQADGQTKHTFTVQATEDDRLRTITIPAGLTGYQWRLYVDPSQAALGAGNVGMFQLFNHSIKFQQADRGEVGHTFDWDDMGHPWDKYLRVVTVEWDNTDGNPVVLQLDTLSGIGGQTLASDILSATPIVLTGGRGKRPFPLPADTIAKMIRLYPKGGTLPTGFRQWKYTFDKEDYPADIVFSTPWRDSQNPNDKNPSWLSIDADTEGIAATVQLVNESGLVMSVRHTGTISNRKRNYPIPVDQEGKMWRLLAAPDTNGKFQLFGWGFARWQAIPQESGEDPPDVVLWTPWNDFGYPYGKLARNLVLTVDTGGVDAVVTLESIAGATQSFTVNTTYETRRKVLPCNRDLAGTQWRLLSAPGVGGKFKLWDWFLDHVKQPAAVTQWASYQQAFGYLGWKLIVQMWLEYECASPLVVTLTSDTGVYSVTLPAHTRRLAERFYPPVDWGAGLNKSKLYDVAFSSATPAQIYAEMSGVEWVAMGAERRAAMQKVLLSEFMQMAV